MQNEYADSKETKGIRAFFYLKNGLSLLNEFKNLILFVFAAYFALKIDNIIYLVLMFLVSLPLLMLIGWYCVERMNKILEWLSIRYGTHFAIKQFQINENILETLKNIENKLK